MHAKEIVREAKFQAKNKCFPQILFPVPTILIYAAFNFQCADFDSFSLHMHLVVMCVDCMRMQPEALSSLLHSQDPVYPATQATP